MCSYHAGWLSKQTTRKKISGRFAFTKRYFILRRISTDISLSWYESLKSEEPKGVLQTTVTSTGQSPRETQWIVRACPDKDKPMSNKFVWELTVPGVRIFVFRALSDVARDAWVDILKVVFSDEMGVTRKEMVDEGTIYSPPRTPRGEEERIKQSSEDSGSPSMGRFHSPTQHPQPLRYVKDFVEEEEGGRRRSLMEKGGEIGQNTNWTTMNVEDLSPGRRRSTMRDCGVGTDSIFSEIGSERADDECQLSEEEGESFDKGFKTGEVSPKRRRSSAKKIGVEKRGKVENELLTISEDSPSRRRSSGMKRIDDKLAFREREVEGSPGKRNSAIEMEDLVSVLQAKLKRQEDDLVFMISRNETYEGRLSELEGIKLRNEMLEEEISRLEGERGVMDDKKERWEVLENLGKRNSELEQKILEVGELLAEQTKQLGMYRACFTVVVAGLKKVYKVLCVFSSRFVWGGKL